MKVIELFIKLSEGREIPYKIKYEGYTFEYNINHKRYESYFSEQIWTLQDFININDDLNNEIEIIEEEPQEHKIPEKFEIYDNSIEWCCNGRSITDNEKDIMDKINEIIDYLEEIK